MTKQILLLGRKGIVVEDAQSKISETLTTDIRIFTGTNIDDVRSVFSQVSNDQKSIDHVFMGAGIDLEKRLETVKEVFILSQTTTVHLKDASSGPQGFLLFVKAVLRGFEIAGL